MQHNNGQPSQPSIEDPTGATHEPDLHNKQAKLKKKKRDSAKYRLETPLTAFLVGHEVTRQ